MHAVALPSPFLPCRTTATARPAGRGGAIEAACLPSDKAALKRRECAVLFWSLASPKPNSTVGKKENGKIIYMIS